MVSIGYLVPSVGLLDENDIARRENIAAGLVEANVDLLVSEWGPKVIESEVEEALAVPGLVQSLTENEDEYDAFVISCFGDPGLRALRELTEKPIVGPAMTSYHTAVQLRGEFSLLNIVERSEPLMKRIIRTYGFDEHLASVRTLGVGVTEIDHDDDLLVKRMISTGRSAVETDGAKALIPGCMGLSFMQVHEEIADELGVPFLDPVTLALNSAQLWARHDLASGPDTTSEFPRSRIEFLLGDESSHMVEQRSIAAGFWR